MSDGELDVDELVATVRARGVRPSVADHLSRDVAYAVKSVEGVRAYLDALEPFEVARGGEFCWHDALWRELPDELHARFTHRIGSLHAVMLPGREQPHNVFSPTLPTGLTPSLYMEHHLGAVEQLAREMPIEIFAHPTLVPIPLRALPPEELWSDAHEERLVEALFAADIAFEVSSRYKPHRRLVERAHARGVRLSLGSDGHTLEQVGVLSFSLALVRAVGARPEDCYDPYVHGKRPRAAARG